MLCSLTTFASTHDALLALLLFGVGMGLSSAPAQSASMAAIAPEQAGMAAGVSSTMRYLGGITSILVLGAVLGDDASVSMERHDIMVRLFAGAIALSGLACLKLPGRQIEDS
jgi:MFS family permease